MIDATDCTSRHRTGLERRLLVLFVPIATRSCKHVCFSHGLLYKSITMVLISLEYLVNAALVFVKFQSLAVS